MDPTAGGAAAIRGLSSISAAAINRYRPVGVARCGSPEDRAQAYRRLLEAVANMIMSRTFFDVVTGVEGITTTPLLSETSLRMFSASGELMAAVRVVQLCAPAYVIAAAEDAAQAALSTDDSEQQKAQRSFMQAARHDLDYNPRAWHLLAKRKERKFRQAQARKRLVTSGDSSSQSTE